MTITTTTLRVDYTANGVNTTFAFPFPVFYESNATPKFSLQVVITDLSNVESIKTETTDYTISYTSTDLVNGILKQGNVVLNTAPANNFKVSILRNLNLTQNADFTDKGTDIYSGGVVESALDKLTLVSQQIQENLNRVVKLPKSSQLSGIEFPINATNADQVLAINTAGNNLTTKNLADVSLATLTNFAKTLLDDENASQARTTLDAQQLNANLTALAGLTGANNKIPYFTGAGAMSLRDLLATSTAQGILALTPNKIIPISNNTTDATNDIDVGAGWFNFDDGTGQAYYGGGTGQLDIVFGTNNGMLDTGTIANTTYHLFLIHNPTTIVSKILASTSVSSPTMPSGYTKKARIGSIIRASGAILAFEQFDKKFILGGTKIVDRAIAAPPTTASNQTVTAPAGISTRAVSLIECEPSSANGNTFLIIEPTTHTSTTPTSTNHTLFVWHQSGGPISLSTQIETKTNTSSQILINANISTSHNLRIIAVGWIDYQLNY